MADLIREANEWLESKRNNLLSQSITYTRDALSVALNATLGNTRVEEQDANGYLVETRTKDFVFQYSEFVEQFGKPQAGDRIAYTEGDEDLVYEVQSPAGMPLYYSDSYRLSMRVHTQLVSE